MVHLRLHEKWQIRDGLFPGGAFVVVQAKSVRDVVLGIEKEWNVVCLESQVWNEEATASLTDYNGSRFPNLVYGRHFSVAGADGVGHVKEKMNEGET